MRLTFLLAFPMAAWTILVYSAPAENYDRCGGDGPIPLSVTVNPTQTTLKTRGSVLDFQVWERHGEVVYRNQDDQVFRVDINGTDDSSYVTSSPQPITHFADPKERFLLTDIGAWFFDVERGRGWIQFNQNIPSMRHVFWDDDDLYSIASTFGIAGDQWLRLFRYHAGDDYVLPLCSDLHFDAGHRFSLVSGHAFPYIYLYQLSALSQGNLVNLFRLNVLNCDLEQVPTFKHLVPGNVQNVYRFDATGAVAVKIDHPSRNLMWDLGNGRCQYFDVGNIPPFVLNPRLPVIATWTPNRSGITLYDFNTPETQVHKTTLLDMGSQLIADLGPNDFYLTNDGQHLFVKPELGIGRRVGPIWRLGLHGFLGASPKRVATHLK